MSAPKRTLPSVGARDVGPSAPSIEQAREALGGRVGGQTSARVGHGGRFTDSRGRVQEGVIVCETEGTIDVWIGDGRFQRVASDRCEVLLLDPEHPLADVAADARVFTGLAEGSAVRFVSRDGKQHDGRLAERCRYGALVSADGRIMAVSFRRIWPGDSAGS